MAVLFAVLEKLSKYLPHLDTSAHRDLHKAANDLHQMAQLLK
jgi:hypothetical protein